MAEPTPRSSPAPKRGSLGQSLITIAAATQSSGTSHSAPAPAPVSTRTS